MRRLVSTGSPFERQAGYSRAVVSGEWCFVAGTTGYDYGTMTMPDGIEAQARQAWRTIEWALDEAGFALRDVVRARYVVTDRVLVPPLYDVLGEVLGDIRPAATLIVAGLAEPEMLVEIDVTAHRPR